MAVCDEMGFIPQLLDWHQPVHDADHAIGRITAEPFVQHLQEAG